MAKSAELAAEPEELEQQPVSPVDWLSREGRLGADTGERLEGRCRRRLEAGLPL